MAKVKGQKFIEESARVEKGQSPIDVAVDLAEDIKLGAQYDDFDISARLIVAPPDAIEDRYRTLKGELFVPVYAPFVDDDYNDFIALLTRKIREVERADVVVTGIVYRIAQRGDIRIVSDGWTEPRERPARKGGKKAKAAANAKVKAAAAAKAKAKLAGSVKEAVKTVKTAAKAVAKPSVKSKADAKAKARAKTKAKTKAKAKAKKGKR